MRHDQIILQLHPTKKLRPMSNERKEERRIFKKDPMAGLDPAMTGSEFVAAVATLSPADQEALRARIHEILQERDL